MHHILPLLLGERTKFLKRPQRWCTGTPITSSSSVWITFFLLISFLQGTGRYLDYTSWGLLHGFNSPYPFDRSSVICTGKSSPKKVKSYCYTQSTIMYLSFMWLIKLIISCLITRLISVCPQIRWQSPEGRNPACVSLPCTPRVYHTWGFQWILFVKRINEYSNYWLTVIPRKPYFFLITWNLHMPLCLEYL